MKQVLFICTGNTCRSPMAEAIAKSVFCKKGLEANVYSRGIYALDGESVSENAVLAMNSMDIDISNHTARRIRDEDINNADYIFTMTESHKEFITNIAPNSVHKLFTIGEYAGLHKDMQDPFGRNIHHYIACAAEIKHLLTRIADKLIEKAKKSEESE